MKGRVFTSSIRRHLLCWLLAPIISLCAIFAFITNIIAVSFATEAYDGSLLESAHSVANQLNFQASVLTIDLPPAAVAVLKSGGKDKFYYKIKSSKGEILNGDDNLIAPKGVEITEEPQFYNATVDGKEVRMVALKIPDQYHKDYIILLAAETTEGRKELIQSILLAVVLPQLLLIVAAAFLVWLGVARGLKPLTRLKEAVESRNAADLRLLEEEHIPKEVKPLVLALNRLLSRLQEDREAQRRFVSNAAHQLRTPLAGLKTQAELALRHTGTVELTHSLKQINSSADRATRLAQQLLTLARLEPSVFKTVKQDAIDLNKIARDATGEAVPMALSKGIDLGFEGSDSPQVIKGDAGSLHELAANLIENAILYTQQQGKITVRVLPSIHGPALSVEDNGPGIPENERQQVFERFYRILGNKVPGSGLGLAIVREIAEAHNATVRLANGADGKGTLIQVQFGELDFTPEPPRALTTALSSQT